MESVESIRSRQSSYSKGSKIDDDNDKSSPGIFSSVGFRGIRDNLLSGFTSKLEAAFHAGFDVAFTDNNISDNPEPSSKLARSNTSASFPRKTKNRSVFGQPAINGQTQNLHRNKGQSLDSLDTIDSGQGMGGGSSCASISELRYLELHDPLKFYRTAESIGIGSGQSTSIESSDAETEELPNEEYNKRCDSQLSVRSWASTLSCDSQAEEFYRDAKKFMKSFVGKIFSESHNISLEEKAKFGDMCQSEIGRLWFARYINEQRTHNKKVSETTFYSLAQYFAIVLFECSESDDFTPAKTIMNMCFTYYHEPSPQINSSQPQQYLYYVLREQPIWRTIRFWNAAFFDAVQCERANRPTPTRSEVYKYNDEDIRDEAKFQENITFGQLGAFTHNMHSFGLPKEFCLEFLRKQCIIANLQTEQLALLRENIERIYANSAINSVNRKSYTNKHD